MGSVREAEMLRHFSDSVTSWFNSTAHAQNVNVCRIKLFEIWVRQRSYDQRYGANAKVRRSWWVLSSGLSPYSLVEVYQCFVGTHYVPLQDVRKTHESFVKNAFCPYPEGGGSTFIRIVCKFLPRYTLSHSTETCYPYLWESEIQCKGILSGWGFTWRPRQNPVPETSCCKYKIGQWIMFRIVTVILQTYI
jgi:hypothetical protein